VHVQPRVMTREGRLAGGVAFTLRWE